MKNRFMKTIIFTGAMICFITGCGQKTAESSVSQETVAALEDTQEQKEEKVILDTNTSIKSNRESAVKAAAADKSNSVTIIYTSDVHGYMNNQGVNAEGETVPLLGYGTVSAMKTDLEENGENVIIVDTGDHIQGNVYCSLDQGDTVIELMNKTGYDVATIGNHEFDYGIQRLLQVSKDADFSYVSCNFYQVADETTVFPAYTVVEKDGVKVAFIGISTPETLTKAAPAYFKDGQGNFVYNIYSGTDGSTLYEHVQQAIDEAKTQADYVVALGHLGSDKITNPYGSRAVIANTTGLDVFIDGHSHSYIEYEEIADGAGKNVVLTQAGSYMESVGMLKLTPDGISVKLVTEYDKTDRQIDKIRDSWVKEVEEQLGRTVAHVAFTQYINDPQDSGNRMVRLQETNLGDMSADSIYYYFNMVEQMECDAVLLNGGGIRQDLPAGDFSYETAKKIHPFGNKICMIEVSGQAILDALEWGTRSAGVYDAWDNPLECAGFPQVAGISFSVDSTKEPAIIYGPNETWASAAEQEYRVHDVKIYRAESGEYEPLDVNKTYTLAGSNFILRDGGDGYNMFQDGEVVGDLVGEDYLIFADYLMDFAKGEDGLVLVKSANSPLVEYEGYKLNYETASGSGRIKIK